MVSSREIKRRISRHLPGLEVSKECVEYVQDLCSDLIDDLIEAGVKEFHKHNRRRKIQHLRKLKRVTPSLLKSVLDELNKEIIVLIHGEVGQSNDETTLSHRQEIV